MVNPEIRKVIDDRSAEFGIDPDLVESLVLVESSGNPHATRYEPAFYKHYLLPLLLKNALTADEARGRATSYGLMQIMGQVARERGFIGVFELLFDPATGLEWALKHLKHFIDKYAPNLDDAIASYNAGSPRRTETGAYANAVYVSRVYKYLGQIKEGKQLTEGKG